MRADTLISQQAGFARPCDHQFWQEWQDAKWEAYARRLCTVSLRLRLKPTDKLFLCWGQIGQSLNCDQTNAFGFHRTAIFITLQMSKVLGSDDEIACIIGHEAGHVLGPDAIEPGRSKPTYVDELYADATGVALVMKIGYDARACPLALKRAMGEFSQPGLPGGGFGGPLERAARYFSDWLSSQTGDPHPFTPEREQKMMQLFQFHCRDPKFRDSIGCQ